MSRVAPSPLPELRNEGQRMLLHVTGTLAAIAAEVGATKSAVHEWRAGEATPKPRAQRKIEAVFGIPARAWSTRPGTTLSVVDAEPVTAAVAAADAAATTTLAHCMSLLAVISAERAQTGLLAGERVKLADAEARILALRHRLEAEAELSEDRYVRDHPAWLRVRHALVQALVLHPAAARAVAEALADLDM